MRLTVLGGNAAGPNPGAGCSGYLVQNRSTAIVVDLGPGTVPELKKHIDPRFLDGIVISHGHHDHMLDLITLRYSLKCAPSSISNVLSVWIPPGVERTLAALATAFSEPGETSGYYDGVYDIANFDPSTQLATGDLTIDFAMTVHPIPTWAMRIESADGGAVGYTADTGPTAPLANFFRGVSLLVSETTLGGLDADSIEPSGHLTAAEAGQLASDTGATSLLLTHFWEEIGVNAMRLKAAERFAGHIDIARPGLIAQT
jgi:ribonuclease BN (tRNA processing enzyme)